MDTANLATIDEETTTYACFGCLQARVMPRKQADRGGALVDLPQRCPHCQMLMQHVGNDFIAPDPKDKAGWSTVVLRIQSGELH